MSYYIVIETEEGLDVAEVAEGKTAEDAAAAAQGVIIDPGPHKSFEDAREAMLQIPEDEEERARLRD